MHLLTQSGRRDWVAIAEDELDALALAVIEARYPDYSTEASHDDHSYHDGPPEPTCVHCRIRSYHRGDGYAVALGRLALSLIREEREAGQMSAPTAGRSRERR